MMTLVCMLIELYLLSLQATAIQKILCQDSQRKKREGKLQKQREEMEQVGRIWLFLALVAQLVV